MQFGPNKKSLPAVRAFSRENCQNSLWMDKLFGAYHPYYCFRSWYSGRYNQAKFISPNHGLDLTGDARLEFLRKCVSALSARASRLSTYKRLLCARLYRVARLLSTFPSDRLCSFNNKAWGPQASAAAKQAWHF